MVSFNNKIYVRSEEFINKDEIKTVKKFKKYLHDIPRYSVKKSTIVFPLAPKPI
jgi:hypothetical protein